MTALAIVRLRQQRPSAETVVRAQIGDRVLEGVYWVRDRRVHVRSEAGREASAPLAAGDNAEHVAEQLLAALTP